jgi:hypothetical protein
MSAKSCEFDGRPLQLLTSEDGCVLLDIEHDRILKLNSVAAEMLVELSVGQTDLQIARNLSLKYQVSEQRVAADIAALRRRIVELGIDGASVRKHEAGTHDQSSESRPSFPWYGQTSDQAGPKPPTAMVVAALVGLAIFDLILSLFSLKVMCACVRSWPVRSWPVKRSGIIDREVIGRVCNSVHRACVWYPKRTLCLQRSAVTTCLLRVRGVSAAMKIGVRPMPFMAHAWVEADGFVVNDWPKVKKFYSPLVSH